MSGRGSPSIRLLVTIAVVAPIVVTAATLFLLTSLTLNGLAERLGRGIVDRRTSRVSEEVRTYLSDAERVSNLYTQRLARGVLKPDALRDWAPFLYDDLMTSPQVASICFGNTQGDATYLMRAHGQIELGIVKGGENDRAADYAVDADGNPIGEPLRITRYDPRERPWWTAVAEERTARWTDVYFWFGDQGGAAETGAGFTRPIRAPSGDLIGVLVIDVTLSALSEFLRGLEAAKSGYIAIVDEHDLLVAASAGSVTGPKGERLSLAKSDAPTARAIGTALARPGLAAEALEPVQIGGERYRVRATALTPSPGIRWRIIVAVPESMFMDEARDLRRSSLLIALVAAAGAVVLGVAVARRIARPVEAMTAHVRRVGKGDFEHRLSLRGASELAELSAALNSAAAGLKQRMELAQAFEVATKVQQNLLPAADPTTPGLDIAGGSRYCDQTGGDYFDFIEVSPAAGGATLIALGDVEGHGVGSALLMATARAALRAHAASDLSLGGLLTRVNAVLAGDSRHGKFMTMCLLLLDPTRGTARWASAGHDPVLLRSGADGSYSELDGGDVPLGIAEGVVYEEYVREGVKPGDILIIGSDGIWEMQNAEERQFGKERMKAVVSANAGKTAKEIASALWQELTEFRGSRAPQDDVTWVVIRVL